MLLAERMIRMTRFRARSIGLVALAAYLGPASSRADDELPYELSLHECATIAVNGRIGFERIDVDISDMRYKIERGGFMPVLSAGGGFRREFRTTDSDFVDPRGRFTETGPALEAGVKGRFKTGTSYSLLGKTAVTWTTMNAAKISPQYRSSIDLQLVQPLLRNWGVSATVAELKARGKERSVARDAMHSRAEAMVLKAVKAYWDLYARLSELGSVRQAIDLLSKHLGEVRGQSSKERSRGGFELLVESAIASARESLATAERRVVAAEQDLLMALYWRSKTKGQSITLDKAIRPSDRPKVVPEVRSLKALTSIALAKRPSLVVLKGKAEAALLRLQGAQKTSLPKLDLVANLGLRSLTGTTTFGELGHELVRAPGTAARELFGEYGNSWEQVFTGESPLFEIKFVFEVPLDRSVRTMQEMPAMQAFRRAKLMWRIRSSDAEVEVRSAFLALKTDTRRVRAADASLKAIKRRAAGIQDAFGRGGTGSLDVVYSINLFSQAQSALGRASAAYMASQARLEYTVGNLRRHLGVKFTPKNEAVVRKKKL